MLYRRFGKTELQLPVFTLGGMRFKHGWTGPHDILPDDSLENAYEVARHALSLGMNHFESARDYGRGERLYGHVWHKLAEPNETKDELRKRIIFTTKIAPIPTYSRMRECIDESLERLQIDYIDNLDIHGINSEEKYDIVFKPNGCLNAVYDAMKEGLIHHIGFSTHGDLSLIMKTIETNVFESVNLHYYYFFQRNFPAIKRANEKDMGVFIISPNDKGGQLFNPSEKLKQLCAPLSPMNFNDHFCLAHPEIHTLSLGANTPEQIDTHLPYINTNPINNAKDVYTKVKQLMDAQQEKLKSDKNYCTVCYQCLPCPVDINIPEVLRFHNLWKGYDMEQFVTYRYNMLQQKGDWFPGEFANKCTQCGDCLPRCPEKLAIPQMLFALHERFYHPKE